MLKRNRNRKCRYIGVRPDPLYVGRVRLRRPATSQRARREATDAVAYYHRRQRELAALRRRPTSPKAARVDRHGVR